MRCSFVMRLAVLALLGCNDGQSRFHFVDADGQEVRRLRYGEPFAVRLDSLVPGTEVTIQSSFWGYEGQATFRVRNGGVIDTAIDTSLRGTYDGISPEGLLWSMQRVSNTTADNLDVHFSAMTGGTLVEATIGRVGLSEGLVRIPMSGGGMVGTFFKPAQATAPLPGLIVVGGSEGGIESASFQAAWLAGYGYAALGLAYFDVSGLPAELKEIPIEYFGSALNALRARSDVDSARIGVVGTSRGGELALMLGQYFPSIVAVVAQVPSAVMWGALSKDEAAAWTYEGRPLPYLTDHTGAQPQSETLPNGSVGYRFTPIFEAALNSASAAELAAVTIAVEKIQGAVLLLAGADDGLWPSCRFAQMVMNRLIAKGHSSQHADAQHCFDKAGHFVAEPGWPTTESYAINMGTFTMILGGTPRGNADAARQGLTVMRAFLDAQLKN